MDSRVALKNNTVLRFEGGAEFVIENELARGGSSIVYNGYYMDNAGDKKKVRLKECYPFKCRILRGGGNELLVPESDRGLFEEAKRKMLQAYRLNNRLLEREGLTNYTANTYNTFQGYNTLYIVSPYVQGQSLSCGAPMNVREKIAIVKSLASAVQMIHQEGYLYLDIKPENVFTIDGTSQLIQLFDFDTLVPIELEERCGEGREFRISYTKGFAALEQQTGELSKVGEYSDVYGIGALLFYLLFGRTPDAFDCEPEAEYDYGTSALGEFRFRDRLYFRLTDFFHHTLASYYPDRFQTMGQAVESLAELEGLADETKAFLGGTRRTAGNAAFFGREKERAKLQRWAFGDRAEDCARQRLPKGACWLENASARQGLPEEMCQHENVCQRLPKGACRLENASARQGSLGAAGLWLTGMAGIGKTSLARRALLDGAENLRREERTILFTEYNGSVESTVCDDWQIDIHTVKRDRAETSAEYYERKIAALREIISHQPTVLVIDNYTGGEAEKLERLLEVGWKLLVISEEKCESDEFSQIELGALCQPELRALFGRSLGRNRELSDEECEAMDGIIESVAGHTLTVELIARQIQKSYLTVQEAAALAAKYGFSNISIEKVDRRRGTVRAMIAELFHASRLSHSQKTLMRTLSAFSLKGVGIHMFSELVGLTTKDGLNELESSHWIIISEEKVSLHPVIRESVRGWEWTEESERQTVKLLTGLTRRLQEERWKEKKDFREISLLLETAEGVSEYSGTDSLLRGRAEYRSLLYNILISMPRDREEYLLEKSSLLLADPAFGNGGGILRLYEMRIDIFKERRDFPRARAELKKAGEFVRLHPSDYGKGLYYCMAAAYYDDKLSGFEREWTQSELEELERLMRALDKAILCMRRSSHPKARIKLADYMEFKVNMLIRQFPSRKSQIETMLKEIRDIVLESCPPYSVYVRNYYLSEALYASYILRRPCDEVLRAD